MIDSSREHQTLIAKSLNRDARLEANQNRQRSYHTNVMKPPHLTLSVNMKRELEKDAILKLAQRANHLTGDLVAQRNNARQQARTLEKRTSDFKVNAVQQSGEMSMQALSP